MFQIPGFAFSTGGPRDTEMLVACRVFPLENQIAVFSGGGYFAEPVAIFVDRATALRIAAHFCDTGELLSDVEWKRWIDLDWVGQSEELTPDQLSDYATSINEET